MIGTTALHKIYAGVVFTSLLLLHVPCTSAQDYDIRDPLELDGVLGLHRAVTNLAIPVGVLAAALVLTNPDGADLNGPGTIREKSWFFQIHSDYYRSYHENVTNMSETSIGIGYHLRRWVALGIDLHITALKDPRINTSAIGGRPFIRWYLVNKASWALHFQQGFGRIFIKDAFPPGGTKGNYTPTYSLGAMYKVSSHGYLQFTIRHYHISNGGYLNNPGFDSNGAYIGYQVQM